VLSDDLLRQLVRTYPQATAGTPGPMTYDADTGDFRYRYTPSFATDAPTEIYLSDVQYAAGYAVAVTGACASSSPGDPILALRAVEGATGVDVRVTAGTAPWPSCDGPAGSTPPPPVAVPPPASALEVLAGNILRLLTDAVHAVLSFL
jgi:endoglycosylceramidase